MCDFFVSHRDQKKNNKEEKPTLNFTKYLHKTCCKREERFEEEEDEEKLAFQVPVFVRGHLCEPQNGIMAGQAMVMGLFAAVLAIAHFALLTGCEFFEAGGLDGI